MLVKHGCKQACDTLRVPSDASPPQHLRIELQAHRAGFVAEWNHH